MKKLLLTSFILAALYSNAQTPAERPDSLLQPARTDSADFSNSTYKHDSVQVQQTSQPIRRDSLPVDDRKPKNPPKK